MATFTKQILRPGKYLVKTPKGERREENISLDRISRWVDNFKQMKEGGLNIPAPWMHDGSTPIAEQHKGSKNNAGFWEDLWMEKDGSLYGKVNVPREEDASRVGTTVTEVSPYIEPKWSDGSGKDWEDSILHIGLVTLPVAKGQKNFTQDSVPALALAFSLSDLLSVEPSSFEMADNLSGGDANPSSLDEKPGTSVPANASGASMRDVIEALKAVKVHLPDDTGPENLAERIITAVKAIKGTEDEEEDENLKEQPSPIVMSTESDDMSEDQKLEQAENRTKQALELAASNIKAGYQVRVKDLVKTGKVTPAYSKKILNPLVKEFQLLLDPNTGKPEKTVLDQILEPLEQLESGNGSSQMSLQEEELPDGMEEKEETAEETEKAADNFVAANGMAPK